jgi:hypothetical protein
MPIRDTRIPKPLDREIDTELVFEERRAFEVTLAMNPRPRDDLRFRRSNFASGGKYRPPTVPKQRVLGLLHVDKK